MTEASKVHYRLIHGPELGPWLEVLGRLRIAVFREFPYLYDGDPDYERDYLRVYERSPRSLVALMEVDGEVVGATTCLPLEDEGPEFQEPFRKAGIPVGEVMYLGESVILPAFRGRGAGHRFFELREAHAREVGPFRYTAFCAVDRGEDHPQRPDGYRPLDQFWTRLGYRRRDDLPCTFSWKEIGEKDETPKQLTFWTKEWR